MLCGGMGAVSARVAPKGSVEFQRYPRLGRVIGEEVSRLKQTLS